MGVACLEFRGEKFRGWLKNREIRESFLPLYGINFRGQRRMLWHLVVYFANTN